MYWDGRRPGMGGTPEPRHGLDSEVIAAALLPRAWDGCRSARLLRLTAGPGPPGQPAAKALVTIARVLKGWAKS